MQHKYFDILKAEVLPALGCTEPIAIALAVAKARALMEYEVESIELFLSSNIIKNAMGVGIPGTNMVGIEVAAALGAIGGNAEKSLEVLADITQEHIKQANQLVSKGCISITLKDVEEKLYIEVICKAQGHEARAIIKRRHDNIVHLSLDGNPKIDQEESLDESYLGLNGPYILTIEDIYHFATTIDFESLSFVLEGARMNRQVAEEGLQKEYGLKVGRTVQKNIDKKILSNDLKNYAVKLAAAASDARMAGSMQPVMTNSGSGNQGITVILPVVATAEWLGKNEEELGRALTIAHLTAVHVKSKLGRLSALCGVIGAATGASCGIVYLLGGGLNQIYAAIKNMIGNVSGMFCDGAKTGCALKVATVVDAAVQSAMLAMDDIFISKYEGIIEDDIEKCIQNLGILGSKGMVEIDRLILDIMLSKNT